MKSRLSFNRFIRPANLFCAGLFFAGSLLSTAVAGVDENTDVARWSDSVWNAAKSGDLATVEAALKKVPESRATAESKRLRDLIAARGEHVDASDKTRAADRAKALEDLKTQLEKKEFTKALTAAVRLQTLSDDMKSTLQMPEIVELIKQAEVAEDKAQEAGDWMVAQEILYRLKTLYEESGDGATLRRYDAKLDEVNKRITLLAQYAPRQLYELRKAYAERVEPGKPVPPFNEAFANDWKETLDGISKGMLVSALNTAANEHISAGGWEPLVKGGLDAVRVLATTGALKENFPGLGDKEKTDVLLEAVNRNVETLAHMNRDAVGKPQFNSALRDILEANQKGPNLPTTVLFREFGDGAIEELSGRFEDEYSQIIWPEQLRRFEQMVKGNFVGVGIMIRHDDKRDIQVINPLEGGPAFRSGVENDDRIVAVDGKSTLGWTLNKAVDSITGPAGRTVTLTVKREGEKDNIDIPLVREEIKIRSVNGWWKKSLDDRGTPQWDWYIDPKDGIGYIRLSSFNDDSFEDFMAAIADMRSERQLNGLILDLRFNPGGLLKSAVEFSNVFMDSGKIVSGQDRNGNQVWQMSAEPQRAVLKDLPLVVIVNQGSASASEILSGTLKAHDRAVVLGDRSFGKGSVQTVHPCGDGRSDAQMKLTTQYYVLPPGPGETKGRLVHKRPGSTDWGVYPDVVVKMTPAQIEEAAMLRQKADDIGLKNHKPKVVANAEGKTEGKTDGKTDAKTDADPAVRPSVEKLLNSGMDPQLELALLLLQAKTLKDVDAAAQASATEKTSVGAKGG